MGVVCHAIYSLYYTLYKVINGKKLNYGLKAGSGYGAGAVNGKIAETGHTNADGHIAGNKYLTALDMRLGHGYTCELGL